MEKLSVEKAHKKLLWLTPVALLLLAIGIFMLSYPHLVNGSSLNLVRVLGGIVLVCFWITFIYTVKLLADKTAGLVLDKQGFVSQVGFVENVDQYVGEKILWKDIKHIRPFAANQKRFVQIELVDEKSATSPPETTNQPADLSQIHSGPRLLLSTSELKIEFDELLKHFFTYHQASKQEH